MFRNLFASMTICLITLLSMDSLWAQKNNRNKQDEKRENQRVAQAQKELRERESDWKDALQKLRALMRTTTMLEANVTEAKKEWREKRERVADEMAKALGIDAALEKVKVAKADLSNYSQPILEKLHTSEAWKAAKSAAQDAKQEIEKVREDVELSDEARVKRIDTLTQTVLHPNELDRQAILSTAQGKELTEQVNVALAAVEKIRRSVADDKIDAHPTVVAAKKAIEQAEQVVKKHAQELSSQRTQLQKAEQQVLQSRQKLQQAQAADARDKNRK